MKDITKDDYPYSCEECGVPLEGEERKTCGCHSSLCSGCLSQYHKECETPLTIVNFYRGKVPDPMGRTIENMWGFTDLGLERGHTYIQWLFPLREPSPHNPSALTLDKATEEIFAGSEDGQVPEDYELQTRLLRSFEMMMRFYRLRIVADEWEPRKVVIEREPEAKRLHWISPMNHNYLRLTRIMTSCRLLGLPEYSQALFECLMKIAAENPVISPTTLRYWHEAVGAKFEEQESR